MFITPEIWTALLILNKFLVYLGISAAIGISVTMLIFTHRDVLNNRHFIVSQWQTSISKYGVLFISVAFIANLFDFLVQVGNMSETGLKGMFEPIMLNMLWVSSVGTLTVVRAIAFALAAAMMIYALRLHNPLNSAAKLLVFGLFTLIVIFLLSVSFTLSGHTNTLEFGSVTLITLHVAIAFAWLGSLVPLLYASYCFNDNELYLLMHRFGRYASWVVAVMLIAGTVMLVQLVPNIEDLFSSAYGQLFILKIVGVLLLLAFAIAHKFFLVPHILQKDKGAIKLRHSIIAEAVIGLLVLFTTSIVTTAVGPAM
ncbi:copper resistance D family protein [Glaciecola sp. SC05]|uniref:copper resistance D family protein n=1 Tax=Glaciecola sp. SC05 TaxID=1987355 RepID=UPI003527DF0E